MIIIINMLDAVAGKKLKRLLLQMQWLQSCWSDCIAVQDNLHNCYPHIISYDMSMLSSLIVLFLFTVTEYLYLGLFVIAFA